MSGSNVGRAPRDDSEWARDVERRLRALERKQTVRIGNWVLSERAGELVATAPGREPVVLTAELAAADSGVVPQIQRVVTIVGSPSSGATFTLIYRGAPTTALPANASQTAVLNALLALSVRYTVLDFNVTGANGGPWTITLPQGSLSADDSQLTGATVQITTAT